MVTLAVLLIGGILLILIIILDMFLYDVSFMSAFFLLFEIHISLGKMYLVLAGIVAIGSAIISDFRRKKSR